MGKENAMGAHGIEATVKIDSLPRTPIQNLRDFIGQEVKIQGWVHAVRDQKRMRFLIIRDNTGSAQVTIQKEAPENQGEVPHDVVNQTNGLTKESTVSIVGVVEENRAVKLGGIEIRPTAVRIDSLAETPLPIPIFEQQRTTTLDIRLDWRFLDLREEKNRLVFEIQTAVEEAMREHWVANGFIEIHSPKLMGAASESGSELFKIADYFGKQAYLAQSPQFYKQMAMAAGLERVFEIGPVFRANPSFTSRHDTEFTSVDMETSWINSHEDVMAFEERWLRYIFQSLKDKFGDRVSEVFGVEVGVPTVPFPRIPLKEAIQIVNKMGHKLPVENADLDPEGERLLAKYIKEQYDHDFVFVTDYPISVRPFYHMRYVDDPNTTKSFDLIHKGLEITTGAQREHRYDILLKQAREKGLDPKPLQFYLDFFKYGCPPHGGFGFGLTRLLMTILDLKNVREVTYLYRGPNRLSP